MPTRLLLALIAALLLIVRLPSLAQPMGPDQGLYAYVGERILHGELAYRDAWDQKPPGIHYVYAALRLVSARDVMVPLADLGAAALTAAMLWTIGARLGGPAAGAASALLFLLLSDPGFARYGGVRVRAQCETFIALAVTGALASSAKGAKGARGAKGAGAEGAKGAKGAGGAKRAGADGAKGAGADGAKGAGADGAKGAGADPAGAGVAPGALIAAGFLIGIAFALKYNAGLYGAVVLLALAVTVGLTLLDVVWIAAGAAIVPAILLLLFWSGGALNDLYQATIAYNVRYSGETYASRFDMLRYLVTFPIQRARLDALWLVGGLGCLSLLAAARRTRVAWIPLAWVGAACVSIAINGSRGLPQYFLQAAPALALAAGVGLPLSLVRLPPAARWIVVAVIAVGAWRAGDDPFPKLAGNVWHDTQYVLGRIDRRTHLARYGGARDEDKYSALDNMDVGAFLASKTKPDDTVYVFGYSPGAYVYADRRSASRFFWSRPVILDFNREEPRYGVAGLLTDLQRSQPAYVILQEHDWAPDVQDSGPFFLSHPLLSGWLHAGYRQVPLIDGFTAWERNGR
jgi:hypothetical protein